MLAAGGDQGGSALRAELARTRDELHRTQVMVMQVSEAPTQCSNWSTQRAVRRQNNPSQLIAALS